MSIFTKRGLLLDNALSDVNDKTAAFNAMLADFAGGDSNALSTADLAPLLDISTTQFNATQAFKRMQGFLPFNDPGDDSQFDLETFKNRIENNEQYIGKSSYFGGNGLTGRFYKFSDLPQSYQDQLSASPFTAEDLFDSPGFSIDDLKAVQPSVRNDNLWINGDFSFRREKSFLEKTPDIKVALFTGFVRMANEMANISGAETFDGIIFNHAEFDDLNNPNLEITNVVVRAIIEDITTGEVLLDATHNPVNNDSPDTTGVKRIYQFMGAEDNPLEGGPATDRSTKQFEKYKLYKVTFLFIITPDIEEAFQGENKRIRMRWGTFAVSTAITDEEPMHRNYFYNENFLDDSPPHNLLTDGEVKKNEKVSLSKYGSILNHHHTEPSFSPQIAAADDISHQIGTPEAFVDVGFDGNVFLGYKAIADGYNSIANLVITDFQFTNGKNFIYLKGASSDDMDLIKRGNFIYGLVSSDNSGGKRNGIYVKDIAKRKRIIYLSEPANFDTDLEDSPEELAFINHLGHIGYGTLSGATGTGNLEFTSKGFHGQRSLRVGDFVYAQNNTIPGLNGAALGTPNYFRVKYLSPLTLETIATNGTKVERTTMTADASTVLHYYAANALDNQVLDSFCTVDDSPPFRSPLLKAVVAVEHDENVSPNGVISISSELIEYDGTKFTHGGGGGSLWTVPNPGSVSRGIHTATFTPESASPILSVTVADFELFQGSNNYNGTYVYNAYNNVWYNNTNTDATTGVNGFIVFRDSTESSFFASGGQWAWAATFNYATGAQSPGGTFAGALLDTSITEAAGFWSIAGGASNLNGKFVVFDGGGVNSVIPSNTQITGAIDSNSSPDTIEITVNNVLGGRLPEGSFLTLADDFETANRKFSCFPPTDPSAPFKADGENISTVPEVGRDEVKFTTSLAGNNTVVQFDGIKLIDDTSPSMIETHTGASTFSHKLRIIGFKEDGETECEYFIPLDEI